MGSLGPHPAEFGNPASPEFPQDLIARCSHRTLPPDLEGLAWTPLELLHSQPITVVAQHNLGRERAAGRRAAGMGQGGPEPAAGAGKHRRQHRWLRSRGQSPVSISRPKPLVFGFRLFAVSGLSLLTQPWLVNNPWRGHSIHQPQTLPGTFPGEQNPTCCLSSQKGQQLMQKHLTSIPNRCHSHTGLLVQCPGLSSTSANFCPLSNISFASGHLQAMGAIAGNPRHLDPIPTLTARAHLQANRGNCSF